VATLAAGSCHFVVPSVALTGLDVGHDAGRDEATTPADERSAPPGPTEIRCHGDAYSGFPAVSKVFPWWVFCPSSQLTKGVEWLASMPIVAVVTHPGAEHVRACFLTSGPGKTPRSDLTWREYSQ
jgi:hypothetical protein